MKTTTNIIIAVLTVAVLTVLCTPLMTQIAQAQAYNSYASDHHAIAYLAEKETREKEVKAQNNWDDTITAQTDVADDQNSRENKPDKSTRNRERNKAR